MYTTDLMIFITAASGLVVLSLLMLFKSWRHDRVVQLAGPLASREALEAQVIELRKERDRLTLANNDLREVQGQTELAKGVLQALQGRIADLEREWEGRDEQRSEIRDLRVQTEQAATELLAKTGELERAKAGLDLVKERLAQAEGIETRLEELRSEEGRMRDALQALSAELGDLQAQRAAAEALGLEIGGLNAKKNELEAGLARLEGQQSVRAAELAELEDRVKSARTAESELRSRNDLLASELSAARQSSQELAQAVSAAETRLRLAEHELRQTETQTDRLSALEESIDALRGELAHLQARRDTLAEDEQRLQITLEEKNARLQAILRETEKSGAGRAAAGREGPPAELSEEPEVIRHLRLLPGPRSGLAEDEALDNVRRTLQGAGLSYHPRVLTAFHTAMKVNDTTQMAVLAGISGTGKSQLPRNYAAGMGIGFLQVPVQPRWDSPQDLMGFYNYIESRFRPTDMAKALWALDSENNINALQDRMMMVLLDEMNLARVEYYFSDFLSRLESRPAPLRVSDPILRKDAELELEIPGQPVRIFPGYNLLFAGTMNEDESTQSLSDKVVDRANVMRFGAPKKIVTPSPAARAENSQSVPALSYTQWKRWTSRDASGDADLARSQLDEMLSIMQTFGKPFGHRLGRAILSYVGAYPQVSGGGDRVRTALADQIEMRLLPKLRGVDVTSHDDDFRRIEKMASDLGDEPLAAAIRASVDASQASTLFSWQGVVR
ncbi:chromosome segregation ATPase-like protein [Falsigemmobacter faecalis]|uniref:Chromosome segregation ATPase-like protein n=1 Tax=Falsigemmobacter faecalis TaxID=2488730 RepID=A0A3P3D8K3_9RHOB|nr:chromosome segregation ATPase-like protein [Falsigemmobacter faecalis]RRH70144.1 chromosome segregation ATPase-like protein [Falsigemmobacter faecalis]